MTCVRISDPCTVNKLQGNTDPVGFQLLDNNGDPMDLSAASLVFVMVNTLTGEVVLNDGTILIDDAVNGLCHWTPGAGETDVPGNYAGYVQEAGAPAPGWPYDGRWFRLVIVEW